MDTKVLKNVIRIGQVSSQNPSNMTVKVVFPGAEDLVSADLAILNRGSQNRKDYWVPDVGEQVLCIFPQNVSGRGSNEGYVVGSFFSDADSPQITNPEIRRIDFGDGSFIEHNRSTGNLTIHATGNIIITGATVHIN